MIFRSPKWLRKIIDFEILTGDDISGRVSWNKKWNKIVKDGDILIEFIKSERSFICKYFLFNIIMLSDLPKIKSYLHGDFNLFEDYEKWLAKKEDKKRKQKRIKKELNELCSKMSDDFSKFPYADKYYTYEKNGITIFHYKFENGNTLEIGNDSKINYFSKSYKQTFHLNREYRNLFIELCNKIGRSGNKRTSSNKKIDKLKESIKLREDQLAKMGNNDPMRKSLKNELENYKSIYNKMKSKQYK